MGLIECDTYSFTFEIFWSITGLAKKKSSFNLRSGFRSRKRFCPGRGYNQCRNFQLNIYSHGRPQGRQGWGVSGHLPPWLAKIVFFFEENIILLGVFGANSMFLPPPPGTPPGKFCHPLEKVCGRPCLFVFVFYVSMKYLKLLFIVSSSDLSLCT